VQLLNEFLPQEIRLVNRLASAQSDEQIRQLLEYERDSLNSDFLQLLESAAVDLEQSKRTASAERLRYAAEQVQLMLAQ
jgi:DNA-dependent RNA polymerase auxiliary subunit epsilon